MKMFRWQACFPRSSGCLGCALNTGRIRIAAHRVPGQRTQRLVSMNIAPEKIDFVAVLVFEEGPGRRSIEAHKFSATHPEVAYQCALAKGAEERYGRSFVGLAELAVTTEGTRRAWSRARNG